MKLQNTWVRGKYLIVFHTYSFGAVTHQNGENVLTKHEPERWLPNAISPHIESEI
jgi:hypothetical protein